MLKKFFKVLWEVGIVVFFLLALAMIGSGEPSSKESGYTIFMLYGIVCYLLKRINWLISKFRNSPNKMAFKSS